VTRRFLVGALQERDFRLLFLARSASMFGDSIAPVALAFAVLDLTGSATDLGFVMAARIVPFVVFLLVGGVWADRVPRQLLMMASDLGRFATQAVLAALLLSGNAHIWQLVVLQALHGTAGAFFRPASVGLIPQTVLPEHLQQANALLSLSFSTAGILGPVLAGALVATLGPGWAIAIDAVSFAVSAAFLVRLRLPPRARAVLRASFAVELREGWREVRTRTWLWVSIGDFMVIQFLFLPSLLVLGPLIAKQELGGATAWATIVAAVGVGSVVGDVVALRFRPRRPLAACFAAFLLATPVLVLLGGAVSTIAIAFGGALFGFGNSIGNTLWFVVLQQQIPEHALSRVSSYDEMGSAILRPVGFAAVGPIAAALGTRETVIGAAAITAATSLVCALLPSIRSIDGHPGGSTATTS
jgi:MFS family permease